jgi:hypothetical protein
MRSIGVIGTVCRERRRDNDHERTEDAGPLRSGGFRDSQPRQPRMIEITRWHAKCVQTH